MAAEQSDLKDEMFHLHRVLVGHTQDVRALATSPSGAVVSGSRDASIRVWAEVGNESSVLKGHGDYVSALALSPIDDTIVSGSRDNTVRLWTKASSGEYALGTVLSGHEYQVTGVTMIDDVTGAAKERVLASTSVDGSIRLWKVGEGMTSVSQSDAELREHEGPVLCCCSFGNDSGERLLVTGSGDCTMRLWKMHVDGTGGSVSAVRTTVFHGHTDTVRSVAYIPSLAMIVSGSHDTFVKVWTVDGSCLTTMEGHGALVFSVASSLDGTLVASGSEDNTARVWSIDGSCKQVIRHPGCVWAVAFLPNGDLVTGCADGAVRVWSTDGGRVADADVVAAYEASLAEKDLAGTGGSTIQTGGGHASGQKMKMHDPSILCEPGQHDGQTIVVNEGSFGMVYSWNQQAGDWERVGEVVMEGADDWDFNFDVDIADDRPKLKLKANAGDDAYAVADRFIAENALPTSYREQIAQFLITNTNGAVNINVDSSGAYADPLTGAGAYVPSPSTGGAGRPSNSQPNPTTNVDPFTGSALVSSGLLPMKGYTLFSTPLASDSALAKLRELNPSAPEATISSDEAWEQVRALTHDGRDPTSPAIQKILASWPLEAIFPVLDAYRALLTTPQGRLSLTDAVRTIGPSPPQGSLGAVLESVFVGDQPASNPTRIVSLRLLSNLFDVELIPVVIAPQLDYLLNLVKGTIEHIGTKGIAIAYTTLLMNAAVYLQKVTRATAATSLTLAGLAGAVIERSDVSVASSVTNALLVLGTLRRESLVKPQELSRYAGTIKHLASTGGDCQLVASEVANML